jgi:hypothetical protein
MTLNNTTDHDIYFNIDSGEFASIKGQQCRVGIPANGSAVVDNALMFLLILCNNFQAAYIMGYVTVTYSAADDTFFDNVGSLLDGSL